MIRRRSLPGMAILGALIAFGGAIIPGKVCAADKERPSLTMEELEVRGRQEKPDTLFLPVPAVIRHSAPVRLDLFREDMTRPVLPWEIDTRR
jgi:hypothetical protein